MKPRLLLLLYLFLSFNVNAVLIKPGIVRTFSTQYAESKRIPNVKIYIQGRNALVSNNNGEFSIILDAPAGSKFTIDSIICSTDYQIENKNIRKIQYVYSIEPIEILLKDLKADKIHQRKIEKRMEDKYQKLIAALDADFEAGKIDVEEHERQLQLYRDSISDIYNIVREVSKRIYHKDQDKLDETEKALSEALNSGDLSKCRALQKSLEQLTKDCDEHQSELENSKQLYEESEKKLKGEIEKGEVKANDCRDQYLLRLVDHNFEEAKQFIYLSAKYIYNNYTALNMDANYLLNFFEYQYDAGVFSNECEDYQTALTFFKRLEVVVQVESRPSIRRAKTYKELATTYKKLEDYKSAEKYFRKAREEYSWFSNAEQDFFSFTQFLNNYGQFLQGLGRNKEAKTYIENAYYLRRKHCSLETADIIESLINLAGYYWTQFEEEGGNYNAQLTKKQEKIINQAYKFLIEAEPQFADVTSVLVSMSMETNFRLLYGHVLLAKNEKEEAKIQFQKYYRLVEKRYGALSEEAKSARAELQDKGML